MGFLYGRWGGGPFCSIWVRGAGAAAQWSYPDKRRRARFDLRGSAALSLLVAPYSLAPRVDVQKWIGERIRATQSARCTCTVVLLAVWQSAD